MPLPLLFIGIAAVTGVSGVSKTIGAAMDQSNAKKLNQNSDERIENAALRLEELRRQCGEALDNLGKEKIFVLDNNVKRFLNTFKKIKNVDFQNSEGLEELSKFHVDSTDFEELEEISSFASSMAKGSLMGIGGGALLRQVAWESQAELLYSAVLSPVRLCLLWALSSVQKQVKILRMLRQMPLWQLNTVKSLKTELFNV